MIDLPEASAVPSERRWALKILQEHQRKGGKRYAITVLVMAKRALGLKLNVGEVA
ncbi:hypothetical protein [Achromobacter ruhlandii]|uniref:hypothetical protein n=1 Tax=Achromobacter ruhlandii TaxID=72557 RepID=UPI000AB6E2CD|nr:hypothetical protein [Achromobacter ruhlandii]